MYIPSFFEFLSPLDDATHVLIHILERNSTNYSGFHNHSSRSRPQRSLTNDTTGLSHRPRLHHKRQVYYASLNRNIELVEEVRQQLPQLRFVADTEMDTILELYDEIVSAERKGKSIQSFDIVQALEDYSNNSNDHNEFQTALRSFHRLYYEFTPTPRPTDDNDKDKGDFFKNMDWAMIQRGIDVFITYSPVIAMSLYYLSLIPGFSIPLINKVLQETKYLAPPCPLERVKTRLIDTGAFIAYLMVHDATDDIHHQLSLMPGGRGWKMALRVRCLHAKVRRSLLKSANKWDTVQFGVPINQEDMAATLLAFSLNVLYGIEFVAGTPLSNMEKQDYMVLWRYVGWLLGVDTRGLDPCNTHHLGYYFKCRSYSTSDSSVSSKIDPLLYPRVLMESILSHIMKPDESSVAMAHHLLKIPARASKNSTKESMGSTFLFFYRGFMCRKFIGDELADQLHLPSPSTDHSFFAMVAYLTVLLILLVFRCYTRLIMNYPCFRRRAYNWHYRGLCRFLIQWENPKTDTLHHSISLSCPYYSRN